LVAKVTNEENTNIGEELADALIREDNVVDEISALRTEKLELAVADKGNEELANLQDALAEALARESKLVDDISSLTNGNNEFSTVCNEEKCNKCIDMENTIAELKNKEDYLTEKARLMRRITCLKEEIGNLKEENVRLGNNDSNPNDLDNTNEIKVENDALKRRLGSDEYKFLSTSAVEDIVEKMEAETKTFYSAFKEKNFGETEKLMILLGISNDLVPAVKHILYKNLMNFDTAVQS
jgi:hypothetical protein